MSREARKIKNRQDILAERTGRNRRYTDVQRATALLEVQMSTKTALDNKIADVSQRMGIPRSTIRNWVREQDRYIDKSTMEEIRGELGKRFETEIDAILEEMKAARAGASYRDLAIALGILFDKTQLLNGQSTENVQQSVTFVRQGLSSLPEHLAQGAIEDHRREEEV